MQQPVEDGRGDDRIAKDIAPTGQALVGSEDDRPSLVPARDELEKKVRSRRAEREITNFVDLC